MEMTVSTKYGLVEGVQGRGCRIFKGVPYAAPPVGERRFAPPAEPERWEGVREAKAFSNRCFQLRQEGFDKKEFYSDEAFKPPMSEDCLYLNIWTPEEAPQGKGFPVAVYIHGGAFLNGFGSELEFDGEAFARHGVILVTINYRLGIFGFLAHPLLTAESPKKVSGNYGILDQLAALSFVRENIEAFGGDPESVMVFGQSAGAMSVQTILSSPLSKGLVQRAVMESGGSYKWGLHSDTTLSEAEAIGEKILAGAGIESLEQLRALPAEELMQVLLGYMERAMAEAGGDFSKVRLPMTPVIDGFVLPHGYDETIERGELLDVPVMLGSNTEDMNVADELLKGTQAFSFRAEELHGRPSYVYRFERRMPGDEAGAFHSAELWYVFGTYGRCWRPLGEEDAALSERMVRCWTNFARTGEPGENWRPCRKDDPYIKHFDIK